MKITYIGRKPRGTVGPTGIQFRGPGDTQEVPDGVAPQYLQSTDRFARHDMTAVEMPQSIDRGGAGHKPMPMDQTEIADLSADPNMATAPKVLVSEATEDQLDAYWGAVSGGCFGQASLAKKRFGVTILEGWRELCDLYPPLPDGVEVSGAAPAEAEPDDGAQGPAEADDGDQGELPDAVAPTEDAAPAAKAEDAAPAAKAKPAAGTHRQRSHKTR